MGRFQKHGQTCCLLPSVPGPRGQLCLTCLSLLGRQKLALLRVVGSLSSPQPV